MAPHVSEKAASLADSNNQYVFKVAVNATKAEIKKSVEQLFKVKGKVKRNKYGLSAKPTWKKAYVQLEQGQDIDFAVAE
jgi:large subunit ribosomal protein L23